MIAHIYKLLMATAAITLVSCTATYRSLSPAALAARGLKPGEGLIIGKFVDHRSGGGPEYGSKGQISIVSVDQPHAVRLKIDQRATSVFVDPLMANMVSAPNEDGTFAIPVPAGRYIISSWLIKGNSLDIISRLPLHADFTVTPGKAAYLGRVNVLTVFGRSLLGIKVLSEGVVLVTDSSVEDIPAITRSYPTINRSKCEVSTAPKTYSRELKRVSNTPRSALSFLFPNLVP
jgi:hypothetical protein